MKDLKKKRSVIILSILALILLGIVIALMVTTKPMPVALLSKFSIGEIWHEGKQMNNCAECHNASDFHTCETCHDEHGSVELAGVKYYEVVELTGDVPNPSFVRVNEIIPDQEHAGTHITLFDFLSQYGVNEFESITFTTNDGGIATIDFEFLDETAMLIPYIDGVRFVTESVHSSTWLKGISRITVVGKETPLTIDGKQTSIGRLLVGQTFRYTVEGSDTMLTNSAGETSHAFVANWVEGALLLPLLKTDSPELVIITDANGISTELTGEEIQTAIIAVVRDKITLVLPERGRSVWPTNIISIESQKNND